MPAKKAAAPSKKAAASSIGDDVSDADDDEEPKKVIKKVDKSAVRAILHHDASSGGSSDEDGAGGAGRGGRGRGAAAEAALEAELDALIASGAGEAALLAADAATIPAGNLTALNATTTALTGFADAAIKLNAVPLNVPSLGGLGGGGGTSVTFAPGSIVVQAAPGMNAEQVASLAVNKIEAKMRGYR